MTVAVAAAPLVSVSPRWCKACAVSWRPAPRVARHWMVRRRRSARVRGDDADEFVRSTSLSMNKKKKKNPISVLNKLVYIRGKTLNYSLLFRWLDTKGF